MSFTFSAVSSRRTLPVSYYDIMGVSPSASNEEIKRGYLKQLARFSPYRNVMNSPDSDSSALLPNTTSGQGAKDWELTLLLHNIYKTLMDPQKRAFYDASLWHAAQQQQRESEEEAWKRTFYFVGDLFEGMQPLLHAVLDPLFSSTSAEKYPSVWDTHSEVEPAVNTGSSRLPSSTSHYTVVVASALPQASPAFQQTLIEAAKTSIRSQASMQSSSFDKDGQSSTAQKSQRVESESKSTSADNTTTSNGSEKSDSLSPKTLKREASKSSPRATHESSVTVVLPLRTAVIMSRL